MNIQILKNEEYKNIESLPKKGSDRATGFDIIATSEPEIVGKLSPTSNKSYASIDYIQYRTNLKLAVQSEKIYNTFGYIEVDYDVLAFPRSSVSKYNLVLANCIGLIDADYRGEVLLRFKYIWQPEDYSVHVHESNDGSPLYTYIEGTPNIQKIYKKGDKICQLKVTKVENVNFELVETLDITNRGNGGFGSTDVKKEDKLTIATKHMNTMEQLYNNINKFENPKKYSQLIKERDQATFNK